ncbi:MFS transporter [Brevibacillus daliensis]|uniref:MFS transporter n=1 Tax=Brevibacillus daliensis TaxID=2892995 RepID=UPI001E396599|nr:MFS transporter [Brevibacillus daliensis]
MKPEQFSVHNLRILYWSHFFEGINFLVPVMTLLYFQRGLSLADVFWTTICWTIAVLIFEIPTGIIADRYGAKLSFIVGSLVGLSGKMILLFIHEPWSMYAYNIFWGISITFFSGAMEAFIYDSLKETKQEHKMTEILGKLHSVSLIPMVVAFIIGPLLAKDLQADQFNLLISLNILMQLIEIGLYLALKKPAHIENNNSSSLLQIKQDWHTIKNTPMLVRIFITFTLVFICGTIIFGKMEQPFLIGAGLPSSGLGFLYAGATLICLLVSRRLDFFTSRFSHEHLMYATGAITVFLLLIASSLGQHLGMAILVFLLLRLMHTIRVPVYSQLSNEYIPSGSRATTLSMLSIWDAAFDVVLLSSFAFLSSYPSPLVYGACALICAIGTLISIKRQGKMNN